MNNKSFAQVFVALAKRMRLASINHHELILQRMQAAGVPVTCQVIVQLWKSITGSTNTSRSYKDTELAKVCAFVWVGVHARVCVCTNNCCADVAFVCVLVATRSAGPIDPQ